MALLGKEERLPMVKFLEKIFPRLADGDYQITSPHDPDYNCIAWAVGDISHWWWPGPNLDREFWPPDLAREVTCPAFESMFALLGYAPSDNEEWENGFEKVALFADANNKPTHAARQLANGRWTSKLGKMEDLEHDLHDLEGTVYGVVVVIMKRPLPPANKEI